MKNYTLYFMEAIACISVIFIHCEFPGFIGDIFETLARFAVPFFFIISGYFNANSTENKIKQRITKMLRLFIVSFIIFYIYTNYEQFLINKTYNNILSFNNILNLLLFNYTNFVASHLWYILALIYVYIIHLYCIKHKLIISKKIIIFLCLLPFIGNIINIFCSIITNNYIIGYYRNWLFTGIPFYFLGQFIRKYEKQIKMNNKTLIFLCNLGFLISLIERVIIKKIFNIKFNLYFGTFAAVVTLFIYCIKNNNMKRNFITDIGEKYSLYIYIFHYLFVLIFENIIVNYMKINICGYLLPLIVAVLSLIFSILLSKIINILKKKRLNS